MTPVILVGVKIFSKKVLTNETGRAIIKAQKTERKEMEEEKMDIYKTRYQAEKDRKKGKEKVVKVDGGYTIMTYENYEIWRKQK